MPSPASRSLAPLQNSAWGLAALAAVIATTLALAQSPAALARTTIHLALIESAAALWLMLAMTRPDWEAETPTGSIARQLWTWACITFLIHVACAFHFTHHWSH